MGCWMYQAGTGNFAGAGVGSDSGAGSLWLVGSEAWSCMGLMVESMGSSWGLGVGTVEVVEVVGVAGVAESAELARGWMSY